MTPPKIYSRKEISKILAKASEIQTSNEIHSKEDGLTEAELLHIADEVGISKESIESALLHLQNSALDESFNWLKGTSRIQNISTVEGDFSDVQWEELVHEFRKITGGIGKINKIGNSYEWEQRKRDIGYKHFSFTPQNGQTKIQLVSSWGGFKLITNMASFVIPFTLAAIVLDGTTLLAWQSIFLASAVGLSGLSIGRLFLKKYYEKQKNNLNQIIKSVSQVFKKKQQTISIEEKEVYTDTDRNPSTSSSHLKT